MKIDVSQKLNTVGKILKKWFSANPLYNEALADCEFALGLDSESGYHAPVISRPAYIGDAAHIGNLLASEEVKALFKANKNNIHLQPKWNEATGKYDIAAGKMVGDASPLTSGMIFNPASIGYFENIFKQPLSYSNARELVKIASGSNPWARIMALYTLGYAGFASVPSSGTPANNSNQNVNVQAGQMVSQIINMYATYSLSLEEMKWDELKNNPFSGQMMSQKPLYAKYVLDLLMDYLIIYGNNDATGTEGLIDVNGVVVYPSDSLKTVVAGTSTQKGADVFDALTKIINDFLTTSKNKFGNLKIAVSPYAYNVLASLRYSIYDASCVLEIIKRNYEAGKGEGTEGKVTIEFIPDPMLENNSIFNETSSDYMIITAPEVKAGPDKKEQPTVLCGVPLDEFVYPAIPMPDNTQYKTLKRYAGVFAPVAQAIRVYSGFGIKSGA